MITAKALGAMPDFAISELGERKTLCLLSDSGLAESLIRERLGYIPENALCEFVTGIGRALGEDCLGLLFSPYLTVKDYGAWGSFVLAAPDLGAALLRAQREMRLHSNTDRVEFVQQGNTVSYAYKFGLKNHVSYPDMAYSAVAAMLSIPRSYLGQNWSPSRIEFDFPKERGSGQAEETFGCPTLFDRPKLRLVFPKSVLAAPALKPGLAMPTTRSDIIRERQTPPANMLQSIRVVVDMQIADRNASLERVSQAMGIGPRSVQRQLSTYGTHFRELLNAAKMDRACELLRLKGSSIAGVADALGYREPGNFTRAFKTRFGTSPSKYARSAYTLVR